MSSRRCATALSANAFASPSFLARTTIATMPPAAAPSSAWSSDPPPFEASSAIRRFRRVKFDDLPCVRRREHRGSRGEPRVAPDRAHQDGREPGFSPPLALLRAALIAPAKHGVSQLCHVFSSIFSPSIRACSLGCWAIAGPAEHRPSPSVKRIAPSARALSADREERPRSCDGSATTVAREHRPQHRLTPDARSTR